MNPLSRCNKEKIGKTVKKLAPYISDTAEIVDAELFDGSVGAEELKAWVDGLL